MIVVDTSAIMAVLQDEADADRCIATMAGTPILAISAGTLAELRIVACHRRAEPSLDRLLAELAIEVVPVSATDARSVADAHARWGKGIHPAALNFGDCFAYALAATRGWPLLFVGDDFIKTDVKVA